MCEGGGVCVCTPHFFAQGNKMNGVVHLLLSPAVLTEVVIHGLSSPVDRVRACCVWWGWVVVSVIVVVVIFVVMLVVVVVVGVSLNCVYLPRCGLQPVCWCHM